MYYFCNALLPTLMITTIIDFAYGYTFFLLLLQLLLWEKNYNCSYDFDYSDDYICNCAYDYNFVNNYAFAYDCFYV